MTVDNKKPETNRNELVGFLMWLKKNYGTDNNLSRILVREIDCLVADYWSEQIAEYLSSAPKVKEGTK